MRNTYRKLTSILGAFALLLTTMSLTVFIAPSANAQIRGLTIDFAAAEPTSYNHLIGGGQWNLGNVNTDIARSLAGDNFRCGDIVSYLSRFETDDSVSITEIEPFTITSQFSFDLDTTGQSGAILGDIVGIFIDPSDPAQAGDKNSTATLVSESRTGPDFTRGSELIAQVEVNDLENNEVVIVRMDVKIICDPLLKPTGDLQARFNDSLLTFKNGTQQVLPAESVGVGEKTVPLKKLNALAIPALSLVKTVTTGSGTCPGADSLTVLSNDPVKYCYAILNTQNGGGNPPAPIYNLSEISDDSGIFTDFTVPVTSGLTDEDGDGSNDDLAAGATAFAEIVKSFEVNIDTQVFNTATVFGFDSIINPIRLDATDSATLNVIAPALVPAISINKLTNGADGPTILFEQLVVWSYQLINTGNTPLSNISVLDDQGVTVSCPQTTLAIGQSITCEATGTAIKGTYSNSATVSATYQTSTVSATDTSSYFGAHVALALKKLTNGAEAPDIRVGTAITWTYLVKNVGNVIVSGISVTDDQGVSVTCPKSVLAIDEEMTCSGTGVATEGWYRNLGTASGFFEQTPVIAQDSSTYYGSAPSIDVQKTPDTQVVVQGQSASFTITVSNTGNIPLTNVVVTDPLVPTCDRSFATLAIAEVQTFTCVLANPQSSFTNLVTVTANTGTTTISDSDSADVVLDLLPDISITKTASVTTVPVTGGLVDYTLRITNVGGESVILTSLSDSAVALSSACAALIGQTIAAGSYLECVIAGVNVTWTGSPTFLNTATAVATDPEQNTDTASASATVTFGWYGRTPGFWKNQPEAWAGLGYTTGQTIRSVFTVPTELLKSGLLDISAPAGEDTLIQGLGYRGGTTLSGSFQILMRAAIAALLNEAYYGIYYPGATSTAALITEVNSVLATKSRSSYLALATTLDNWNNAIHSSLP